MNDNTAFAIIIGALCAYGSIRAIALAWRDRTAACDCKHDEPDAPAK